MGDLFRSEEMSLLQFFIQKDVAYDTVDELGKLGLVQFRDVRPVYVLGKPCYMRRLLSVRASPYGITFLDES